MAYPILPGRAYNAPMMRIALTLQSGHGFAERVTYMQTPHLFFRDIKKRGQSWPTPSPRGVWLEQKTIILPNDVQAFGLFDETVLPHPLERGRLAEGWAL